MNKIVAWGDSITRGASDDERGGWVSRLRDYIDNQYGGVPSVYNLGINGDKVRGVLKRFEKESNDLRPDTIILAIGIIDNHPSNYDYSNQAIQAYANITKKIASENHLRYVDLWGVTTEDDLKGDGLHPEATGHEKISQEVKKALDLPVVADPVLRRDSRG